jgi:hypothetical protein
MTEMLRSTPVREGVIGFYRPFVVISRWTAGGSS